jgi:undecaprenyl-diphosphatase
MITLADLTPRRHPVAYARARLDTQGVLTRRIWSYRAEIIFWSLWLAAVAAFAGLAAWVDHEYTLPLDKPVTFGIQELYHVPGAGTFFHTVNRLGGPGAIAVVLLVAFVVLLLRGLRFEALMMAGTGAVRFIQLGVRNIVDRPDAQFNAMRANFQGLDLPRFYPDPYGFPSGHVFGSTIVYGLVFAYAPRAITIKPIATAIRAFCVFEIALIGPARMYVGAHWFSDVVGAALLAGIYLALAWKLDGMIEHLRAVASQRDLATDAGLSGEAPSQRRFLRTPRRSEPVPSPERVSEREPATPL